MPRVQGLWAWLQRCWPGFLVCATVALAARFVADHYSSPVMLMALLLGMAMNFLSTQGACQHGIDRGRAARVRHISHTQTSGTHQHLGSNVLRSRGTEGGTRNGVRFGFDRIQPLFESPPRR